MSAISEERERGRLLNEAWARFQAANLPAMLSALLGWRLGGVRDDPELIEATEPKPRGLLSRFLSD